MQAFGNLLTVVGILVTLVAYLGQHSGVSIADLEPGLTARWRAAHGWVRRTLGLTKSINIEVGGAAMASSAAMAGTILVWHPIRPEDDIAVRVDKLAKNVDALAQSVQDVRAQDRQSAREVADGLSKRIAALDHLVTTRHEEGRQAATAAMRWEVRGLLLTLVGAGLAILG